ncbi:bifunctional phosphoribosylaminoimidazolecarboxamide formyltransferase/inosine monophosphate cyclohydrolase [Thermoplasmatales archaeon SW_10_69_26]|nr:MAG: bifunctional phosphoribosylaminoimidazolecarboxamide formyltransferase/inosine monophosphate cyclohydrolase [Thermoplasmatales archaeon SW_10_69_26]
MDVRRALISTFDKTGVGEFARELSQQGVELVSTGGTAQRLRDEGLKVRTVADVTGQPELFDGRVKTLHTTIHAAILARRDEPEDLATLADLGVDPIDLVCVNLYPFEATVEEGADREQALEMIDIGGPTLLRAAAKNHGACLPVARPGRYEAVAEAVASAEGPSEALAGELALEAFQHTARYDAVIADWLGEQHDEGGFPGETALALEKLQDLRYGENSHQQAAFYASPRQPEEPCVTKARQLNGKELSYNNVLDVDAALETVKEFEDPAVAIIKHATPSGIAVADTIEQAFRQAFATDTDSPYGGIIAANRTVDEAAARAFDELFLECLIAPDYTDEALAILTENENLRVLEVPWNDATRQGRSIRGVVGGAIVQDRDVKPIDPDEWEIATEREPTDDQLADMVFAMRCVRHVKSNSVVFVKDRQTVGIGGGQTSRVDASWIATKKGGDRIEGSVLASDAFFPFRDAIDVAAEAGVEAIIQPGGSIRDQEVIEAADENGIAMVMSGQRAFLH